MTSAGIVYLDVLPNMAGFNLKMKQSLGGVEGQVSAIGKSLAGAFAVKEIGAFLIGTVHDAEEAKAAVDGLRASLNSMGRDLSADIFTKQAGDLQALTGIQDEAIIAGQGLLATFGNISDELLTTLTPAMVDFAARFTGGNIESAARLIGKALNDPIKGVTTLTRVGVSLTDTQKAQIALFVRSGNLMGAQQVVMSELARESRGFAAATATATSRMSAAWNELKETIGRQVLPVFTDFAVGATSILNIGKEGGLSLDQLGRAFKGFAMTLAFQRDIFGDETQRLAALETGIDSLGSALAGGTLTREEAIQQYRDMASALNLTSDEAVMRIDGIIKENGLVTTSTGKISSNTLARKENARAIMEQRNAALASINADFAVADAVEAVNTAEEHLRRLEQQGVRNGPRYEAATRAVADSHLDLQSALLSQLQANQDNQTSAREARNATIEWGRGIGLMRKQILDILPKLADYKGELNAIPKSVTTDIWAVFKQKGGGQLANVEGATGGIVTRPTLALIGESGPEAVVPLNQAPGASPLPRGGGGGGGPSRISGELTLTPDGRAFVRGVIMEETDTERRYHRGLERMRQT